MINDSRLDNRIKNSSRWSAQWKPESEWIWWLYCGNDCWKCRMVERDNITTTRNWWGANGADRTSPNRGITGALYLFNTPINRPWVLYMSYYFWLWLPSVIPLPLALKHTIVWTSVPFTYQLNQIGWIRYFSKS